MELSGNITTRSIVFQFPIVMSETGLNSRLEIIVNILGRSVSDFNLEISFAFLVYCLLHHYFSSNGITC